MFVADDDYNYYLENLIEFKRAFGCKIYAYCLMTNHVHLVVDPGKNPDSLSLLMKRIAGRQTRYVNKQSAKAVCVIFSAVMFGLDKKSERMRSQR